MSRWQNSSGKLAQRGGFTLIEMTASVVLIVAAIGLTSELVIRVAGRRQSLDRRVIAIQEANNLLERWAADDPEIQPATVDPSTHLSESAKSALPGGKVTLERGLSREGLLRLAVIVTWEDRPGIAADPVRLTTWISPESREFQDTEVGQ